ncbi:MAG: CAP domain-containing protein [Bacteroidia bacterium]
MILRIKILILVLYMAMPASELIAQTANSEIVTQGINYKLMGELFLRKLNKLREEKNCTPLFGDKILDEAAKDQADYMLSINALSHSQKNKIKETPQKRVFFYKGTHDQVGENCIKIYLKKAMFDKKTKKITTVNTYEEAAEELYTGWKNSPGHYKNMITEGYDVEGLGYAFGKDSSVLYVAQVFAAKPFIPLQGITIPTDAFGIKPVNLSACGCLNENGAQKVLLRFQFGKFGDSIVARGEDLPELKKIFNQAGDAIYADIVTREQFPCEKNNLLHGSPVFDGVMMEPIKFVEIFKKNKAKDGKNLFSIVAKIPNQFKTEQFNINYAIVKQGYECIYHWPSSVPSSNLEILDLYPKWLYEEGKHIMPDTFEGILDFVVPFERGKSTIKKEIRDNLVKKLQIYKSFVKEVSVKTFSSIEGNSEANIKLQEKRAGELSDLIKLYAGKEATFNVEAQENWEDFYFQIQGSPFEYLRSYSKEEVKNKLKGKPLLDSLDYLLKKTRTARISIKLRAVVNDSSSAYLILAVYKKGLKNGDSLKAFTYQNKLLECAFNRMFDREEITQVEVPMNKKLLPLWTNYIAAAITDSGYIYSRDTRSKIIEAANMDTNFLPMQFNLCIMALRYLAQYSDTLVPIQKLETKMYKCFKMGDSKTDSILVYHMLLNYSILSAYNHWWRYEYDKIDRHLLNIRKYYPSAQITEYEALRLGLLFNLYARYTWTSDLILPYLRRDSGNEDLTFLFVETYGGTNGGGGIEDKEWMKYLKRAKSMNPVRFHDWIDKNNFQYLRHPEIKKEFCEMK